ncbi:hypothetical protein PSPO01_01865 [Paraphaeosphaeria sporulosa]
MSVPYPSSGQPSQQTANVKKRRWMSRSEDEIAENMDRRNLPYRQGWPQLPPLPITETRQGARNAVHDPETMIEAVQVLCAVHHFHPTSVYFAFRAPQVRDQHENYLTLVIAADLSDDPVLFSLIVQIRKRLQQNPRNEDIAIEIIDERVVNGLFTFPITSTTDRHLLDIWEEVYDIAIRTMIGHKKRFVTIEILRRGVFNDVEQSTPTLVITTPSAAEDIWSDDIMPSIQRQISALSVFLKTELLCGSTIHLSSGGIPQHSQTYEDNVPMGSSIGQEALSDHSGTAGGMVKLSNGKSYALTNHHVIENKDLEELLPNTGAAEAALGLNAPGFSVQNQRITCPSNDDNLAFVEQCHRYKDQWTSQQGDEADSQLKKTMADLEKAQTMERTFATLSASSGRRSVRAERLPSDPKTGNIASPTGKLPLRFLLDWSLSVFHSERGMANALPLRQQDIQSKDKERTLLSGKACTRWTVLNNPKCHNLREEVNVGKHGRTTGFTYGQVNPIPTIIDPIIGDKRFAPIANGYGFTVDDCGHAFSFVGHTPGPVVESGDAGSLVLHAPSGDWLGLLFGSTNTGAALFTPIDLVLRDIQTVTGYEVLEPTFNPN